VTLLEIFDDVSVKSSEATRRKTAGDPGKNATAFRALGGALETV
jgi:hypothetical protein